MALSKRQTVFPNSQQVKQSDIETLVRQIGQPVPAKAAIGVPTSCLCRHGSPQAFAMDPLPKDTGRANSGLLKLTCPHLVRAVDSLEDEGVMAEMNDHLMASKEWQAAAADAHTIHAETRRIILDDSRDYEMVRSKLGDRGADAFMRAGVAGSTVGSMDVKCLHAWLADYLFRGADDSPLGTCVSNMLEARGIEIVGTQGCSASCDPKSGTIPTPPVARNKQRLKADKEKARLRRRKENAPVGNTANRNVEEQ